MQEQYRAIPAMDKCLAALLEADDSLAKQPKALLKALVKSFWDQKRALISKGECRDTLTLEAQLSNLLKHVSKGVKPCLRPVLNASGVIIHTNLGRSVLAPQACAALLMAAQGYCNLEMDLESGERGSRHALVNELLRLLTGAEDSLVVNNNAAAVLLMLDALCAGGETLVSRGELVEIGGSFRIPDIMRKSGATLIEVGTTNRTHLADYESAITSAASAIMVAHASNFRIIGFHSAVPLRELKTLAQKNGIPLLVDLGSGNLLDFSENGLPSEPTVSQVLAEGADLVCFSGDKALGGPQAGIIVGSHILVEKLKKNPLARALRCDKLCLAALEATLRLYLEPQSAKMAIPTLAMLSLSAEQLEKSAKALSRALKRALTAAGLACEVSLKRDSSRVGGGSYPEWGLPTTLVCLRPAGNSLQKLRTRLLHGEPALVGRLEKDAFCIDPRTLPKKDYPAAIRALLAALAE